MKENIIFKEAENEIKSKKYKSKDNFLCEVLAYNNYYDIDIVFEDGSIKKIKNKRSLIKGSFKKYDYCFITDLQNNYVGKTFTSNKGDKYTVIRIEKIKRCTYGVIVFQGDNFERFYLPKNIIENKVNNSINKQIAVGLSFVNNKGRRCTITEYRKSIDVTVEFEDGEKGIYSIASLKKGIFKKPSDDLKIQLENKIFTNYKNERFKVLKYINAQNVIIEFEDGSKKTTSSDFVKNLKVSHPLTNIHRDRDEEILNTIFKNNKGDECIGIEYTNCKKVLVQFRNGEKGYFYLGNLRNGEFSKPSDKKDIETFKSKYTGVEFISNFGEKVTVTTYNNSKDVVCRFEDGVETSFMLTKLNMGKFSHPYRSHMNKDLIKENMLGSVFINNLGMKAMCIEYENTNNVTCQFEDGCIIKNSKRNLLKGAFSHPIINLLNNKKSYAVYRLKDIDDNIIYIGRSVQLDVRLYQHFSRHIYEKDKEWYKKITQIDYYACKNFKEMVDLENNLIDKYKPEGNRKVDRYDPVDYLDAIKLNWKKYDIDSLKIYKVNIIGKLKKE